MSEEPELVLHVWPSRWNLPTFTPTCLAAISYLQLTIPGKFIVEECTNPDVSPDGQLPYLSHGLVAISSYPSIVKYVDGLSRPERVNGEEDEQDKEDGSANEFPQTAEDRLKGAKEAAWIAFISAQLGDLVACSLFTLRHNYYDFVRLALAELFPVPQKYYVPDRLREAYKPRLEAAGLWSISAEEAEEEKRKKKGLGLAGRDSIKEAFGKEKVLDKAQTALQLLSRLLGDKRFFFDNPRPTALDALVSAHVLLLTVPPFPNDVLRQLVTESYPSLVTHAARIQSRTLSAPGSQHGLAASLSSSFEVVVSQSQAEHTGEETTPLRTRSAPQPALSELLPSLAVPFSPWLRNPFSSSKAKYKSKQDKEYDRMRRIWYATAALGVVAWVWTTGLRLKFIPLEDEGLVAEETSGGRDGGEEEEYEEGDDEVEGDVDVEE